MSTTQHVTGTVELAYDRDDRARACICCPGFPAHVYGSSLVLDDNPTKDVAHRGSSELPWWLTRTFAFKQLEGRRIRITAELVDDSAEPELADADVLDRIQHMLRDPHYAAGMLEDIAALVNKTGRSTDNLPDDEPTWARH